jgi:hypothetical protein
MHKVMLFKHQIFTKPLKKINPSIWKLCRTSIKTAMRYTDNLSPNETTMLATLLSLEDAIRQTYKIGSTHVKDLLLLIGSEYTNLNQIRYNVFQRSQYFEEQKVIRNYKAETILQVTKKPTHSQAQIDAGKNQNLLAGILSTLYDRLKDPILTFLHNDTIGISNKLDIIDKFNVKKEVIPP